MAIVVTIEMLGFAYLLQQLLDIATQQDIEKFMPFVGKSGVFIIVLAVSNYVYIKLKCTFVKRALLQYKNETFNTLMQKNVGSFMKENTSAATAIILITTDYLLLMCVIEDSPAPQKGKTRSRAYSARAASASCNSV